MSERFSTTWSWVVITVQKKYISRIRAGLHHLERGHVLKEDMRGYIEGLLGSISYLKLFDEKKASKFVHEIRSHS